MVNILESTITVKGFAEARQRLSKGECMPSLPIAVVGEVKFALVVFPNGGEEEDGWMSIYLLVVSEETARCRAEVKVISDPDLARPHVELPAVEFCSDGRHDFGGLFVRLDLLDAGGFVSDVDLYLRMRLLFVVGEDASEQLPALQKEAHEHVPVQHVKLGDDLNNLRGEGDVVLKVDDTEFRAHKWVLEARSPVFRAMLSSKMTESMGCINIDDMSVDTVDNMLLFIHTARLPEMLSEIELADLAAAGDKYGIETLRDTAIHLIQKMILPRNLAHVLALADKKGLQKLRQYCLDLSASSEAMRFAVQESQTFGELSGDLLRILCLAWSGRRPPEGDREFPDGSDWQSMSFTHLTRACRERGMPAISQAEMVALLEASEEAH